MRALYLLMPIALATLTGCGSGPCSDLNSANQSVANKFASCFSQDNSFFAGDSSPCFDQNACQTNLMSCNSADHAVLEAEVACQNSYAGNSDCSFAAWNTETTCVAAASTKSDGGSALTATCAAQLANNPGSCGGDAG